MDPAVRSRWLELALFTAIVMSGAALRWVHLGTPSLWWDELVQIAMAQVGGVPDVLRVVRDGVPPGSGNAGAMPLDYLLLHGWLALAPHADPAHLEIHFRLPAFVWSVCALVALAVFTRRHLGRDVALAATLLLGASMPHILYAAEVRWYSLLVLVTIGHLWAFARLLDAPRRPGSPGPLGLVARRRGRGRLHGDTLGRTAGRGTRGDRDARAILPQRLGRARRVQHGPRCAGGRARHPVARRHVRPAGERTA